MPFWDAPSFPGLVMSTPRLRHRPQVEDEDAAALKLGSGMIPKYTWRRDDAEHTRRAEFNNAGCLLISEVKYLLENREKDPPDTAYVAFFLNVTDNLYLTESTIRRWNTSRPSASSTPPTLLAQCESMLPHCPCCSLGLDLAIRAGHFAGNQH